jgi:hypothetical protein
MLLHPTWLQLWLGMGCMLCSLLHLACHMRHRHAGTFHMAAAVVGGGAACCVDSCTSHVT